MVISGINLGANAGINILYSGTVSAATEAAIMGIRSIAVSIDRFEDSQYRIAAFYVKDLANWFHQSDTNKVPCPQCKYALNSSQQDIRNQDH